MSANRWEEIQNVRDSRANLRSKHAQRKQELQKILQNTAANATDATTVQKVPESAPLCQKQSSPMKTDAIPSKIVSELPTSKADPKLSSDDQKAIENCILSELDSQDLAFPIDGLTLSEKVLQETKIPHTIDFIRDVLLKFESKYIIVTEQKKSEVIKVMSANHDMISQIVDANGVKRKRTATESSDSVEKKKPKTDDRLNIETLLASETARERETKKMNEEVQELLNMASTKELILSSKFKSQGGTMKQFCLYGTRAQCRLTKGPGCDKVHFRRLIHQHTDITLGDCSFLNTCFHMDTCKYVHYEVDQDDLNRIKRDNMSAAVSSLKKSSRSDFKMMSPQWIQCDLRKFDMTVLGKFAVIMADPPWDIHMELPYGTMSDDEMRSLNIPCLQDDGFIFLWVTGRAMELGRECLETWGYRRCDELIWVKTNQLQKLIRTGRTGHWLNHGKEHCLIGVKGNPHHMNRGLDCDVIVAEVRATSHKPDEVYGIIERLSPGTRKIELFGRPHNVQPNWVTLGNQLDGVQLHEEEVKRSFKKRYPDGKCI